jgi:ABC-2 type transport system permease protein
MSSLFAFFRISFKNTLAYRSTVIISTFGAISVVITQMALWMYVFQSNLEMSQYMMKYVVISSLLSIFLANNISNLIGGKVMTGDFVMELLKPVNPLVTFWSTALGTNIARLLNRGVPLALLFSPYLMNLDIDFQRFLCFVLACLISYVLSNIIYMLIGCLAFVLFEVWPYVRLVDDTIKFFSGAIVPITFFPTWLAQIAYLTPFYYLYTFPIQILLQPLSVKNMMENFMFMLIWTVILYVILLVIYRATVKRSTVQGG